MSNDFICYNVLMLSSETGITQEKAREIMARIDAVQADVDFVRDAIRDSGLSDERKNKDYPSMMFALETRGEASRAYNALKPVCEWLSWLIRSLEQWEAANK